MGGPEALALHDHLTPAPGRTVLPPDRGWTGVLSGVTPVFVTLRFRAFRSHLFAWFSQRVPRVAFSEHRP
jgi:hypothetical protein